MSDPLEAAIGVLRGAYYTHVKTIAVELIRLSEGMAKDARDEWIADSLHDWIDGDEWVIYHWRARLIQVVSDNSDCWVDEQGDEPRLDWTAMAYHAMAADVLQTIEAFLEHGLPDETRPLKGQKERSNVE